MKFQIQLSLEQLFQLVEQLNLADLEQFVSKVLVLQARKKVAHLLKSEVELFRINNQNTASDSENYYDELISKQQTETLNEEEYRELLCLSEQIDQLQTHRIEYLTDLAQLHGISLSELIENLGIINKD